MTWETKPPPRIWLGKVSLNGYLIQTKGRFTGRWGHSGKKRLAWEFITSWVHGKGWQVKEDGDSWPVFCKKLRNKEFPSWEMNMCVLKENRRRVLVFWTLGNSLVQVKDHNLSQDSDRRNKENEYLRNALMGINMAYKDHPSCPLPCVQPHDFMLPI